MAVTMDAIAIFADARELHKQAIERLQEDDIRDAAEKAWCATLRATNALILAYTGNEPLKTPETSRTLRALSLQNHQLYALVPRFYTRQGQLHGECFYLGLCEPREDTERRIVETIDYIRDAQALAEKS